jgi:hypothetical protein
VLARASTHDKTSPALYDYDRASAASRASAQVKHHTMLSISRLLACSAAVRQQPAGSRPPARVTTIKDQGPQLRVAAWF